MDREISQLVARAAHARRMAAAEMAAARALRASIRQECVALREAVLASARSRGACERLARPPGL